MTPGPKPHQRKYALRVARLRVEAYKVTYAGGKMYLCKHALGKAIRTIELLLKTEPKK